MRNRPRAAGKLLPARGEGFPPKEARLAGELRNNRKRGAPLACREFPAKQRLRADVEKLRRRVRGERQSPAPAAQHLPTSGAEHLLLS